jgi:hypothetical protein
VRQAAERLGVLPRGFLTFEIVEEARVYAITCPRGQRKSLSDKGDVVDVVD